MGGVYHLTRLSFPIFTSSSPSMVISFMWMVTEKTEWERLHTHTHVTIEGSTPGNRCSRTEVSPGVGVHQSGGRLPLSSAPLQDLVDLIFVVDRHLLQTLDQHAALDAGNDQETSDQTDKNSLGLDFC